MSLLWCLLVLLPNGWKVVAKEDLRLYVSGYSSRLATYKVLGDSLIMESEADLGDWGAMSWLQQVGDALYGMHEVETAGGEPGGAVTRWRLDDGGAGLDLMEWATVGSPYPAHLLVSNHSHGRMLYTANYGGSSFSVLSVDGSGNLGDLVYLETFPGEGETCRDTSHPHQTVVRGDMVWVVDLGCDRIRHYSLQGGAIHPTGATEVEAGAGPRHMVLHPTFARAYLACELLNLVLVYQLEPGTGSLNLLQTLTLSETSGVYGAEILLRGGAVYVTSRGEEGGVIVVYKVTDIGNLEREQEVALAGTWPRSLDIRGEVGAVIDQKGDSVQLLRIEPGTGRVTPGAVTPTPEQPAFVQFL